MRGRKGVWVWAAAAMLVACDDGPGGGSAPIGGQDAASEDAKGDDATGDAGDDGSGPTPDATPEVTVLGGGALLAEVDSAFVNVASAAARFTADGPPALVGQTFGPCVVGPSDPKAQAPVGFGHDAGLVTVTGTTPEVTLTPQAEGALGTGYTASLPSNQEDLLPPGGALVTFTAAGGADIPAFSLVVQAPEPVTLTAPAMGLGASVSTGADLTVTWNAGTGQEVLVTLNPLDGTFQPAAGPAMVCTTADTGNLVVPQAALAAVRGAAGSLNAALGVTRVRQNAKVAGAFQVPAAVTRSTGGPVTLKP